MASKLTVLLDMDSTVYDLLNPTLDYVERRHGIKLTAADITEWRWDKKYNVKPYDFWNSKGTFINLKPFPGAVEAIKKVQDLGIRQVFLSSANFKFATEKFNAVDRDFPFIGSKDTLLTGGNKDLVKGDVLVDDGVHNLVQFRLTGGITVLADMYGAPYCHFPEADNILKSWEDYYDIVYNIERYKRKNPPPYGQ